MNGTICGAARAPKQVFVSRVSQMNIDKALLEKVTAALLDGANENYHVDESEYEDGGKEQDTDFRQPLNADRNKAVAGNNRAVSANQNDEVNKLDDSADVLRAIGNALSADTFDIKGWME